MKVTMEMTVDGLIRTLKGVAHGLAEETAAAYLRSRNEANPNHLPLGLETERARERPDELGSR